MFNWGKRSWQLHKATCYFIGLGFGGDNWDNGLREPMSQRVSISCNVEAVSLLAGLGEGAVSKDDGCCTKNMMGRGKMVESQKEEKWMKTSQSKGWRRWAIGVTPVVPKGVTCVVTCVVPIFVTCGLVMVILFPVNEIRDEMVLVIGTIMVGG